MRTAASDERRFSIREGVSLGQRLLDSRREGSCIRHSAVAYDMGLGHCWMPKLSLSTTGLRAAVLVQCLGCTRRWAKR